MEASFSESQVSIAATKAAQHLGYEYLKAEQLQVVTGMVRGVRCITHWLWEESVFRRTSRDVRPAVSFEQAVYCIPVRQLADANVPGLLPCNANSQATPD